MVIDRRREILSITRDPWVRVRWTVKINVDTGEVDRSWLPDGDAHKGRPASWTVRVRTGKTVRLIHECEHTKKEVVAKVLAAFKRIDEERVERGEEALGWKEYEW